MEGRGDHGAGGSVDGVVSGVGRHGEIWRVSGGGVGWLFRWW